MSCRQKEKIVKENTEGTSARGKSKSEPEPEDENENDNESDGTLLVNWEELPELAQAFFTDEFDLDGISRIEIAGF